MLSKAMYVFQSLKTESPTEYAVSMTSLWTS